MSEPDAPFEAERSRLLGIAYGLLGQVMDAEDVVQEAYLRWSATDRSDVLNPAAYLTTVTTRLAIDRLRSAQRRREEYVGPWLPEPLIAADDPAEVVVEAEWLSMALMAALERLNPLERAVLVLREVLDLDYAEIAVVVDRSVQNCRQIAHRARDRIGDPARSRPVTPTDEQLRDRLLGALAMRDVDQVRRVLAADVVAWSDGGAKIRAARHPIIGLERVTRFLLFVSQRLGDADVIPVVANGGPGIWVGEGGRPLSVSVLELADGQIVGVRSVLNPDKLRHLRR